MNEVYGSGSSIVGNVELVSTPQQVVDKFRDLAASDIVAATNRYNEFAEILKQITSGENPQIRSLAGGFSSTARAKLIEIMADDYDASSYDVKKSIRDFTLHSLLGENSLYTKLTVANMTNPLLVGDIIRKEPQVYPGSGCYQDDLIKTCTPNDPLSLQSWLEKLNSNMFAATTIALQRNNTESVLSVINDNRTLFNDAAHVIAAFHDLCAEREISDGSTLPKTELTSRYRASFVDEFANMVRKKEEQAAWLPLAE